MDRMRAILTLLALSCASAAGAAATAEAADAASSVAPAATREPAIVRIRAATIVVPDAAGVIEWYRRWFDYSIVERGVVPSALARSWDAPKVAGRSYALLASRGSPDVFLRVIQTAPGAPPPQRRPSYGWGSLEIIVSDIHAVRERLRAGRIEVFREPASLGAPFESIFAMQLRGPAEQTINLTVDTGDPARSNLPQARSAVDRLFLVGLNGPELAPLRAFYTERLRMRGFANYDQPIPSLAAELGLPSTQVFPMTLVRAAQKGNTLELHALPAPATHREVLPGDLPAGVAIVSLEARRLDDLQLRWIEAPQKRTGRLYESRRTATTIGPASERLELIELP